MKAKPGILKALQDVLTKELTGINQYFLHSKLCSNWGYARLAKKSWDESMDEMRHADKVMDRILFLEGEPNMTRYDKVNAGKNVRGIMENDLALEMGALKVLRSGISTCLEQEDHATRELFEHILVDEEEHVDWLEAQLEKIDTMGIENYLASHQFAEQG
ncbi:MAG: bacterioferritin [Planctomycetota bacterium]|nr:MAG: bacterioferritin [Planctomycetota bacterium]